MENLIISGLVVFYLMVPYAVIQLVKRKPLLNKIGSVIIVYAIGLIFGNINILPSGSEAYINLINAGKLPDTDTVKSLIDSGVLAIGDLLVNHIKQMQEILVTYSVPIALPLLLFSTSLRGFFSLAPKALLAFLTGLLSVVVLITIGFIIFKDTQDFDAWRISGMLIGLYSGGTPNLASLKLMLNVSNDLYIITHTYDSLVSAVYLFFLLSVGQRFFLYILPYNTDGLSVPSIDNESKYKNSGSFKQAILAVLYAVIIFGFSGAISFLFPSDQQVMVVILGITTLSLGASAFKYFNHLKHSYDIGMYFILVFSLVVASLADIKSFQDVSVALIAFISMAIFGSLALHILFARIFKIGGDIIAVSSIALICSPPFVPLIADSFRNKNILPVGLAIGVLGYAIGNYLGFTLAYILKAYV